MNRDKNGVLFLIDFDGTLFDTTALKQSIEKQLSHAGADMTTLWELERQWRGKSNHISHIIHEFSQRQCSADFQSLLHAAFLHQPFEQFIFTGVKDTLEVLRGRGTVALFTQGDETYQQVKFFRSGLRPLFDYVYIFRRKLEHLEEIVNFFRGYQLVYIDNSFSLLDQANQMIPGIQTVWVEDGARTTDFRPTFTVQSMQQASELFAS